MTNSLTGQFGFSYDALSRRTQLTRPNGVNTNYSYDAVSHLLSVLHQAGSTTLDGAGYGYDYAGNRTSKTNYLDGTTSNYTYDALYQLLSVAGATTENYSYDAAGNRLSSAGVPSYSYNVSNELTSNSSGSYTYDANGNTLSDASGRTFSWDFENRLTQAVVPGTNGGTTTFRYDPSGRRIQKSGPLGTTNFLYSGPNIVEEVDNAGNVLARYTRTKRLDETLASLRSGTTSYYEQDGLGSITSLSDGAGALANTYTFDSYGKLTTSTGTLTNPFQYTGREFDAETGLYYYRERYYDLSAGRFISEDPDGFAQGINFYDYVMNNPIVFIDPFGLWHCVGGANCDFDPDMAANLDCFDRCTHCDTAITSGRRPGSPTHPNGSHTRGQSCDADRSINRCLTPENTRTCFLQCFHNGFCQEEENQHQGTHFHLQLNHVPGDTTRCRQGIAPYNP